MNLESAINIYTYIQGTDLFGDIYVDSMITTQMYPKYLVSLMRLNFSL